MDPTGRRLADLIERGKAAIHKSEQNAPVGHSASGHRLGSGPGRALIGSGLTDDGMLSTSETESSTSMAGKVDAFAGRLLILARIHATEPTSLRLELLRAVEAFILSLSQKH